MSKFKYLLLIVLSLTLLHAQKVALLVETASGGNINSDKDIITIQRLLGTDYAYTIIHEKEASSKRLKLELQNMTHLNKDDIFVFYYSGHGGRLRTGDSQEEDKKDDFLVMQKKSYTATDILIDNDLEQLLSEIKAKKIILVDACHSHSMYKGISDSVGSKLFDGDIKITHNTSIPKSKKSLTKMIYIGASQENESAEGCKDGGIFTLSLEKSLKESGNISFSTLIKKIQENIRPIASTYKDRKGAFQPSLTSIGINEHTLYTKDIFVLPNYSPKENSLKEFLNAKLGSLKLEIQERKKQFKLNEPIALKSKIADNPSYIYLIDMLDKNKYKLIDSRTEQECVASTSAGKRVCLYKDLATSAPFGKSEVYIIVTKEPLFFNKQTKSIVAQAIPLERQLRKRSFSVAKVSFTVSSE